MEFVLEFCLRAFGAGADGFGVVAVKGAGGFSVVSVTIVLISSATQARRRVPEGV